MTPDLVCIGNLLVDDIVFLDGRTLNAEPGGAVLYASLAARLWGARVGAVSVRGDDYPEETLVALADHGVDLAGVRALGRRGVRTRLVYEGGGRRVAHQPGSPTHAEVSPGPDDLPAAWREARAFHISPIPFESQRALVMELTKRRESGLSLDPHEPVHEDNLAAWREVLSKVDAFFPGEDELKLEGVDENPQAALRRLEGGRLRFVVYKRGREGGILYDARQDRFVEWPPLPRLTGDATGAGDAFAGAFLAAILARQTVETGLDWGIITTSFVLEDFGARGLLRAAPEEAERRMREWLDAGTRR